MHESGFENAIRAMIFALREIPGITALDLYADDDKGEYPYVVNYPRPGSVVPWQHGTRERRVWLGTHTVKFVYVCLPPSEEEGIRLTMIAYVDMLYALMNGFARDRFGDKVHAITELAGDDYGWTGEQNKGEFVVGLNVTFQAAEFADV